MSEHTLKFELPSKGLVYPETNPLSSGFIELKYPTAKEENILNSEKLIKNSTVLYEFIKNLIVTPGVVIEDLLLGDFNYLIYVSRILTYGEEYNVEIACPSCNAINKYKINLNDLDKKPIKLDEIEDVFEQYTNSFIFDCSKELSSSSNAMFIDPRIENIKNHKILFKLLSIADEHKLTKLNNKSKNNSYQSGMTNKLFVAIIDIIDSTTNLSLFENEDNISTKYMKIENYIMNLPTKASEKIRARIHQISPDVITTLYLNCNSCGAGFGSEVPFNKDFFWPSHI